MGLFGNKNRNKVTGYAEQDNSGAWLQYFKQFGNFLTGEKIKKFKQEDAYMLSLNLAEIFVPIDAIADRAASVKYVPRYIDTLEEYTPTGNLKRLLEKPNPFDSLEDLVYKLTFSNYSTGNGYLYSKAPDSYVNLSSDNISNLWVLNPSVTRAKLFKEIPNPFLIKDKKELIDYYQTFFLHNHKIKPNFIVHRTLTGLDENLQAYSPLLKCERNINNLLAVYSARYNVYAKNGNAGILSKDGNGGQDAATAAIDPITRDQIIKDLQDRNGLTGDKNFIGISAIPMKFVKTMGNIKELEPFKETEADMITIGGVMGVDKYLLPISENTTFTNKQDAERGLWQNVVKGVCYDRAKDLTKALVMPENVALFPDFGDVEVLQDDKKTMYEADGLYIDNLIKLKEAGQNVQQGLNNITDEYNG